MRLVLEGVSIGGPTVCTVEPLNEGQQFLFFIIIGRADIYAHMQCFATSLGLVANSAMI